MSSYSGNPSLAPAIRERILTTFQHTLDLAERGNLHEASLGCDFILQMDPDFGPARALHERLARGEGPVAVADLRSGVLVAQPASGAADVDPDADTDLFLPDDGEFDLAAASWELPEEAPPSGLRVQMEERLAARDFAAVLGLADSDPAAVAADPELAGLAHAASARQEAAPYVQRFLESARVAIAAGDPTRANLLLEKARSLDPSHPGLAETARQIGLASPAPPSAAPGPAALAGSDSGRIGELLAEGEAAFSRADYQTAIDAWSRIFLIDIDHPEAGQRIEQARRLKAEQERKIEELFHESVDAFENGDPETARRGLTRVLELSPGHFGAREFLDRLDRSADLEGAPRAGAARTTTGTHAVPKAAAARPEAAELKEEILVPPEPGAARPGRPAPSTTAAVSRGSRGRFLLIGSVVLALVAAAVALVYFNRERLFPNASEPAAPAAAADPIARATRLHESGKTALAIRQLRSLPPDDPHYPQAQALISQWEASASPPAPAEPAPAPAPAEAVGPTERDDLLAQAAAAASRGDRVTALRRYDSAAALSPLTGDDAAARAQVEADLAPVAREFALYRDGEYERALQSLWRLHQESPADRTIRRLMADSYYNLAVRDLQREDVAGAVEKFTEARGLDPDDAEIARHERFARTYLQREQDLLFRIYVKYLPFR